MVSRCSVTAFWNFVSGGGVSPNVISEKVGADICVKSGISNSLDSNGATSKSDGNGISSSSDSMGASFVCGVAMSGNGGVVG